MSHGWPVTTIKENFPARPSDCAVVTNYTFAESGGDLFL